MAVIPCSPASARRTREGNDLYHEMMESKVINLEGSSKAALVYGQMNEPAGRPAPRVALTGLTLAEYFRDEGRPRRAVLRRQYLPLHPGQARKSRRCSAAFPSAVGYQPTPGDRHGHACRSASPRRRRARSPLSKRSTCRPTISPTPAAGDGSFAHLDATTVFVAPESPNSAIYPAVDPARLDLAPCLDPRVVGDDHYKVGALTFSACCRPTNRCRTSLPFFGMDELFGGRQAGRCPGAARSSASLSQPFHVAEVFTGSPRRAGQPRGYDQGLQRASSAGDYDDLPESAFYMVGTIDEAVAKARKMAAEAA